jgi:hypothetical protein
MKLVFRIIATVGALLITQVFGMLFVSLFVSGFLSVIAGLMSWVLAFWVARLVWLRLDAPGASLPGSVLVWAFALGGIGFVLGFFGPILFAPDANQGPLLGIFITGPAGFVLGAVIGLFRWIHSKQNTDSDQFPAQ